MTSGRAAVVVTGASTGIGFATVSDLVRNGFTVFAGVRSDADAAAVEAIDPKVRALRLDVTDSAAIAAAVESVRSSGIPVAGLVNNAGIAIGGPLEFLPVDQLRRQFEVNVFGAVAVTQAFLPLLRATRGRIVFVGSISGRLATPFIAPYSASKFALRAITDAMRIELAPFGIGVTLLEPGSVKTPIWAKGLAARNALLEMITPEGRALYGGALQRVFEITEGEERAALPVERVTRQIVRALTAHKPPANVIIGVPAKAGSVLAVIPASLRDRAVRGSMKLP